jgi:hypothetical protein
LRVPTVARFLMSPSEPGATMLSKLLKSADFRQLTSFVSPAFFDVMPVRKIWSRGRSLMTSRGSSTYREAVARRTDELAKLPLAVGLGRALPLPDALGSGIDANAARLVSLYFEQLFSDTPTLLDLRAASCKMAGATLTWDPAPWVCSWDATFISHLRQLYRGFYMDDDATFRRSLAALRIDVAEDLFRKHFGAEQRGLDFKMRDFVDTFHQVFVRCRDSKIELHEDFLPLGVYLATLYEHLDGLSVRIDVRAAFERSGRTNGPAEAPRTLGEVSRG